VPTSKGREGEGRGRGGGKDGWGRKEWGRGGEGQGRGGICAIGFRVMDAHVL